MKLVWMKVSSRCIRETVAIFFAERSFMRMTAVKLG
jgi:hypothetical protein